MEREEGSPAGELGMVLGQTRPVCAVWVSRGGHGEGQDDPKKAPQARDHRVTQQAPGIWAREVETVR